MEVHLCVSSYWRWQFFRFCILWSVQSVDGNLAFGTCPNALCTQSFRARAVPLASLTIDSTIAVTRCTRAQVHLHLFVRCTDRYTPLWLFPEPPGHLSMVWTNKSSVKFTFAPVGSARREDARERFATSTNRMPTRNDVNALCTNWQTSKQHMHVVNANAVRYDAT